jgi:formylglycine-generating enzyme required for sulfatase activity
VEQFHRLVPEIDYARAVTTSPECPMSNVTWYDAARFCRRLSKLAGFDEADMVYPPESEIGPGMVLPEDWLKRRGYRLPTEDEWECACRAGTTTSRFFGRFSSRLEAYARYNANSGDKLWPVGSRRPNPWGLFDVYGNVLEWCQGQPSWPGGDPPPQPLHALRSGTYRSVERENRSAKRFLFDPSERAAYLGLRIARTISD